MLPPELRSRTPKMAKEKGVSSGEIVREALELHLRESDKTGADDPFFRDKTSYCLSREGS